MTLSKTHEARWRNAKTVINKLIEKAEQHHATILYCGSLISPDQIKINDTKIIIQVSPTVSYLLFEADPSCDHGLYETCAEFKSEMYENFVLVKKLKW